MYGQIIEVIAKQFGVPEDSISEDTELLKDLDADSLDMVEILMRIEELFSVHVPESDIDELSTVGRICDYVREKMV